jgi:hypothetical protein
MDNKTPPTTAYLYWHTPSYGGGQFCISQAKFSEGGEFHFLGQAEVSWGEVVFDEKEFKLKSLKKQLGEAQGKVDYIKDEIAKLLAIGYDEPVRPAPVNDFPSFDDDIPF